MSRRGKTGPVARSLMATFVGLALGYLAFFAGTALVGIFEMVDGNRHFDEAKTLLFLWMFLLIPLVFVGVPLAFLIVLPVDQLLASCRANRSVYRAAGMALGALAACGILQGLNQMVPLFFGSRYWIFCSAPMMASTVTGWVIGNQLWRRRRWEEA